MNLKTKLKPLAIFSLLLSAALVLPACNLPSQQVVEISEVADPTEVPTQIPPTPLPSETLPPPTAAPTATETLPPTSTPEPAVLAISPLGVEEELEIAWVQAVSADWIWAFGGRPGGNTARVLLSQDGGLTFQEVYPPVTLPPGVEANLAVSGYFWDTARGWVLYTFSGAENPLPVAPEVWFTSDSGLTWAPGGSLDLTGLEGYFDPEALVFSDPQHGWLLAHVDAGMSHDYIELFRTEDGGLSWSRVMDPMTEDSPQACPKTGMAFSGSDYGWISKDCGGLIDGASLDISEDGGETWWNLRLIPPSEDLATFDYNVCGVYDPILWETGVGSLVLRCRRMDDFEVRTDWLYTTEDGGLHWDTQPYPGGTLSLLNPLEGWAFGPEIYQTLDGGATWEQIGKTTWEGQFSFVDLELGWAVARAVGEDGETLTALVKTTVGGRRWELLEPVLVER